ncbi:MAG: hypothetical protein LQ344_006103 [Seirophora lacunosa]|nr:MAG: hypothetical protein LQ344_006103 [Seirophora lacunosa]
MSSILSQKAVLVVGGCGFLGHHIVSQLLKLHAQVSVLDFKLDRNRIDAVDYHSANMSSTSSALFYAVNVEGTRNLLECARSVKTVKAFVYTSSASVVHDTLLADELVRDFNSPKQGLLTVCLRPAGIFGEGDTNTLQKMIENAQAGKNRFQVNSGENLFD